MPYTTKCRKCYGRGEDWLEDDRVCRRCQGTGHESETYRVQPTIYEAKKDHGWDDIHSWPRYGRDGHCEVCDAPLTGRKKKWCGSRACEAGYNRRMYIGVRWTARHLIVRDGCACRACGETFESPIVEGGNIFPDPAPLHVDHIIPLIDGGTEHPDNLQLLCGPCHAKKTAREATERAKRRKDSA